GALVKQAEQASKDIGNLAPSNAAQAKSALNALLGNQILPQIEKLEREGRQLTEDVASLQSSLGRPIEFPSGGQPGSPLVALATSKSINLLNLTTARTISFELPKAELPSAGDRRYPPGEPEAPSLWGSIGRFFGNLFRRTPRQLAAGTVALGL